MVLYTDVISQGGSHVYDPSSLLFMSNSELRFEIAKVAYRDNLVDWEGAERFVQLMQRLSGDSVSDLHGRTILLHAIQLTECTYYSILIKGLPLLDQWLQDVIKGKFGDTDSDESILSFLYVSLGALKVLPVSLYDPKNYKFGKTVNHLRKHQDSIIRMFATNVVDRWKSVNKCVVDELPPFEVLDDLIVAKNSHANLSEEYVLQMQEVSSGTFIIQLLTPLSLSLNSMD